MMTLEETIKNYEKAAEEKEKQAIWVWSRKDNSYYENCIKVVKELRQLAEWLRELKSYKEQQPCDDCISRAEALRHRHLIYDDDGVGYSVVRVDEIIDLPSVTPTRPKGKWIQTKDDCDGVNFYDFSFECSKCGKEQSFKSTFCPICGAYMREVKE